MNQSQNPTLSYWHDRGISFNNGFWDGFMETSEGGGSKPSPEKKEVGSSEKKPEVLSSEELKQQLADPAREAHKRKRSGIRRGAVIGHNWLDLFRDKEKP